MPFYFYFLKPLLFPLLILPCLFSAFLIIYLSVFFSLGFSLLNPFPFFLSSPLLFDPFLLCSIFLYFFSVFHPTLHTTLQNNIKISIHFFSINQVLFRDSRGPKDTKTSSSIAESARSYTHARPNTPERPYTPALAVRLAASPSPRSPTSPQPSLTIKQETVVTSEALAVSPDQGEMASWRPDPSRPPFMLSLGMHEELGSPSSSVSSSFLDMNMFLRSVPQTGGGGQR